MGQIQKIINEYGVYSVFIFAFVDLIRGADKSILFKVVMSIKDAQFNRSNSLLDLLTKIDPLGFNNDQIKRKAKDILEAKLYQSETGIVKFDVTQVEQLINLSTDDKKLSLKDIRKYQSYIMFIEKDSLFTLNYSLKDKIADWLSICYWLFVSISFMVIAFFLLKSDMGEVERFLKAGGLLFTAVLLFVYSASINWKRLALNKIKFLLEKQKLVND